MPKLCNCLQETKIDFKRENLTFLKVKIVVYLALSVCLFVYSAICCIYQIYLGD